MITATLFLPSSLAFQVFFLVSSEFGIGTNHVFHCIVNADFQPRNLWPHMPWSLKLGAWSLKDVLQILTDRALMAACVVSVCLIGLRFQPPKIYLLHLFKLQASGFNATLFILIFWQTMYRHHSSATPRDSPSPPLALPCSMFGDDCAPMLLRSRMNKNGGLHMPNSTILNLPAQFFFLSGIRIITTMCRS